MNKSDIARRLHRELQERSTRAYFHLVLEALKKYPSLGDPPYSEALYQKIKEVVNSRCRLIAEKQVYHVEAWGETKTLTQWSEDPRCIVNRPTLYQRIVQCKWQPERAMTEEGRERTKKEELKFISEGEKRIEKIISGKEWYEKFKQANESLLKMEYAA